MTMRGLLFPQIRLTSAAGYSPAQMAREARLSTVRINSRAAGNRPGTAISAPWRMTAYLRPIIGPSSPSGKAGSITTSPAPISPAILRIDLATRGVGRSTGDASRRS